MFTEKRETGNVHIAIMDLFQFVNFNHVLKPTVLEQEH